MAERRPPAARPRLVLASGSPFRRRMLVQAGVDFDVIPADLDEAAIRRDLSRRDSIAAEAVAMQLATAKAEHVSRSHGNLVVIGADQVLEIEGEILGKPTSVKAAREHLLRLGGHVHTLPTAVVLARDGRSFWRHIATPRLTMRAFSDSFLDDYLAAMGDGVLESVGGYQIEGLGAQLFDSVEGDYFSIIGLPLLPLLGELRMLGLIGS